ncbi:hypothetical protein C8A05DRAFT_41805 [Staphylotrichum tortipilum]|uniref:Uncharacterized protein n=1 Tax=Staphylotrichum tortipilum TaxID=2831512 RepID=A0AAN6RVQ4_9PEZI|nr:hypothetical protein C8A05DRAFT_41805 [Staphylotrichum longicolle]
MAPLASPAPTMAVTTAPHEGATATQSTLSPTSATTATSTTDTTTATPPPPTDHDDGRSPWDEIERNYYASMHAVRAQQDAKAEADYRATAAGERRRLVENYDEQAALLARLEALRGEYDKRRAALAGLQAEFEAGRERLRAEREREDGERKRWFGMYRRGGLVYRGGEEEKQEKVSAQPVVNGREETRSAISEVATTHPTKGWDETATATLANGHQQPEPAVAEVEMRDAEPLANEHQERPAEQEQRVEIEPAATTALEKPVDNHEQPATEVADKDMPDAVEPTDKQQGLPQPAQEATIAETDSSVDGEKQAEAPSLDHTSQAQVPSDGDKMDGVESTGSTGGSQSAKVSSDANKSAAVERETAEAAKVPSDADKMDVEVVENTETAKVPASGGKMDVEIVESTESDKAANGPELPTTTSEPSAPSPKPDDKPGSVSQPVAIQEAEKVDEAKPIQKDAKEQAKSPNLDKPKVTDDDVETETAKLPEPPTTPADAPPAAAHFPSSSSELSSRHTTPDVDTPVSLGREETTSRVIEVLGESGELIGRLQPPEPGNTLADRITQRPLKRQVRIRSGRKFTAEDLASVAPPQPGDYRVFKFLSFYVQATGEPQEKPCLDCSINHGLYQGCVMIPDDPDFPHCGNCEWNKRRCHIAPPERPSSSRQSLASKSSTTARGAFTSVNGGQFGSQEERGQQARAAAAGEDDSGDESEDLYMGRPHKSLPGRAPRKSLPAGPPSALLRGNQVPRKSAPGRAPSPPPPGTRQGPRKSLPGARKPPPPPSTPSAGPSFQADAAGLLPEITKKDLCLRDDGVVFTDPPLMRGVPVAKISRDDPYWEADWKPIEELVEPVRRKHQERYEQLEESGSTYRDKHLAKRDAKRGRTILKFLEEGELHPYQLVGKQWINYRLTNYDTLFRLAQLLLEELPRMGLDVTPSQWLRQRLHEVYLEKGDKFDVASWVGKAYHDRKLEQLREKNGLPRVGRPPAHATGGPGSGSAKRGLFVSAPGSAQASRKRKGPHETPESTPSKSKAGGAGAANSRPSSAAGVGAASAEAGASQRPKKIKIITSQSSGGDGATKNPKIILNSPYPAFATRATAAAASDPPTSPSAASSSTLASALDYDGYTSSDSISSDQLHANDWRLHQVRTRTFATNPHVTQYWHWVTENPRDDKVIEHQVLESVRPTKWSVFKKPYNFHLKLRDVQEVSFARGTTRVIVTHKKGKDGKDMQARGDVMAQFKRERTKRRFLTFLRKEKGVKVVEVSRDVMEERWNSYDPETLPGPDSD